MDIAKEIKKAEEALRKLTIMLDNENKSVHSLSKKAINELDGDRPVKCSNCKSTYKASSFKTYPNNCGYHYSYGPLCPMCNERWVLEGYNSNYCLRDGAGRLNFLKNQKKKILKNIEKHFQETFKLEVYGGGSNYYEAQLTLKD